MAALGWGPTLKGRPPQGPPQRAPQGELRRRRPRFGTRRAQGRAGRVGPERLALRLPSVRSEKPRACGWPQGQHRKLWDASGPPRAANAKQRGPHWAPRVRRATPQGWKGVGLDAAAQGVLRNQTRRKQGASKAQKACCFENEQWTSPHTRCKPRRLQPTRGNALGLRRGSTREELGHWPLRAQVLRKALRPQGQFFLPPLRAAPPHGPHGPQHLSLIHI